MEALAEVKEREIVTWPDFLISLFGKLTGRHAVINYEFDNLEVSVPTSYGENARHFNWKFNGTVRIHSKGTKGS